MFEVSARSLKIFSALFWFVGGFVLVAKGGQLLFEADNLKPGQAWPWLAIVAGIIFGRLKATYLFSNTCKQNLNRIDALVRPKIWQFFRPRFFVFLLCMIILGSTLSRTAHNNYPFLIGVAILDFSIAVALLGSSSVFWKQNLLK